MRDSYVPGRLWRFFLPIDSAATIFACLMFAGAPVYAATINKCFDLSGKVTYQDSPCDETSLSVTIETPGRQPAQSSAPAGAPAREPAGSSDPAGNRPAEAGTAGFETPQAAWDRMIRALTAGNVDEAMRSVSPELRENYRNLYKSLDDGSMQKLASGLGTLRGVTLIGRDPATAESAVGVLYLPNNKSAEVHFSRLLGRWYVSQF